MASIVIVDGDDAMSELLRQILHKDGFDVFCAADGKLIEQVWGMDFNGDERTVDVHIKRLRQKIREMSKQVVLSTIRGVGYRLEVMERI